MGYRFFSGPADGHGGVVMDKDVFLSGRDKMETVEDVVQEYRYAQFIASQSSRIHRIDKLSPGQYGIDWAAYNETGQLQWYAEFKRRYKPFGFFDGGVIGISSYKIAKLRTFLSIRPALIVWGLDDAVLLLSANTDPIGVKFGGNPKPKDAWEQEPMCYYRTSDCKIIQGPIDEGGESI